MMELDLVKVGHFTPIRAIERGRSTAIRSPGWAYALSAATGETAKAPKQPPVGTSDLKVFLKHQGVFQHHRLGSYGIWVTNTGTAATTKSHPIVASPDTGRGIVVARGGKGTDWQCHKQDRATMWTRVARSAPESAR